MNSYVSNTKELQNANFFLKKPPSTVVPGGWLPGGFSSVKRSAYRLKWNIFVGECWREILILIVPLSL